MAGTKNLRTLKTEITAGIAKVSADLKSIKPFCTFFPEPTAETPPTTKRE